MSTKCPNYEKCPIYNGILKGKTLTSKAYIQFFCDSDNFVTCKRYMVKLATGVCPPNILPNSIQSVEEIIAEYKLAKVKDKLKKTNGGNEKLPPLFLFTELICSRINLKTTLK